MQFAILDASKKLGMAVAITSSGCRHDASVRPLRACLEGHPTPVFDSRVALGAVEFQPEGGLADWGQGKEGKSLLVIPHAGYLPGERVRVTVRFAEGSVPARASFWLVGHAARGTRRVEVYRQPRPADAFKREAADAQAEARQCQEEKAQLLSERNEPRGLMGAAWLEQGGTITSKGFFDSNGKRLRANAVFVARGKLYSFTPLGGTQATSFSVRLHLSNPGAEAWTVAGAVLVDSTGAQVDMAARQAAPILPAGAGTVVVGTESAPGLLSCPCTLKLWEAPGTRVVTLGNIRFPDGPTPEH
ncbi:DUF2381 family protein [Cystobacter fuscus]|uniref:DUF2381 family protein n=1 Tax=Cystobacter fuscus TaxID=43 RepID=UPI0037C136E7